MPDFTGPLVQCYFTQQNHSAAAVSPSVWMIGLRTDNHQCQLHNMDRSKVLALCLTTNFLQFHVKGVSTFHRELLHSTSLSSAAVWWQTEATDAASSSDAGAQNVVGVEVVSTLKEDDTHFSFSVQLHSYIQPG